MTVQLTTLPAPTLPETAETLGELRALLGDRLLTEDSILDTYLSDFADAGERTANATRLGDWIDWRVKQHANMD